MRAHNNTVWVKMKAQLLSVTPRSHKSEGYITVKPVLSGHSKIDKTKDLKPCGSLMQVKSTAQCSYGTFCNTFDLY